MWRRMFRKRTKRELPEEIRRAFDVTAGLVDEAQRVLLDAIPTSRHSGKPLDQAIVTFLTALDGVDERMPEWQNEMTAHEWTNCSQAIGDARSQAEGLQRRNTGLTFEQLNAAIGDVLYPLEVFADAERELRRR
jgi:hypothetical protein